MALSLYAHPFSSYCQKVLIVLYENDTPFEMELIEGPDDWTHLASLWSHRKMPILIDGEQPIVESSIILEYLDQHYPGENPILPADPEAALQVRFMDRYFDQYVMTPMQKIVGDSLREEAVRDPEGVKQAKEQLTTAYAWLESRLEPDHWAVGDTFTMADCAAAPALFYADWVHEIPQDNTTLRAYRERLLSRPSMKRAVDEARPYRQLFPLGAPDRD